MRRWRLALALALAPALAAAQEPPPQLTLDWPAIAAKIVERLALEPGERVLAVAHPGRFEELIPHLRYAVMQTGGVDLGVVDVLAEPVPAAWDPAVLRRALPESRQALRETFAEFDAAVMLPGATTSHPIYAALQDLLRAGHGRTIHFHWGRGALSLPGQPLPPPHVVDAAFQRVQGLVLEIEAGRVVGVRAREGRDAAVAEMDAAGPAGRAFREFALGFNPLLAVPERQPWIPYFGYGAGVVRLSLGDNSELGGRVGGGYVRWNFFTDATVRVGDAVWVEDSRLVR